MPNLGTDFYSKLTQVSSEVGMKPEDLLATMVSESGINPAAHNPGGASGLIQFMPDTLKNVGYKGTPEQFRQTSGAQQLDYVKKYVQDKMKFNGGPFKSAAQYYVANFWPVALKLPGVQQENPNTAIVESNPRTDASGKFSKKYFDLGFKVPASQERQAYKGNSGLFDKTKKGFITYGDMMNQVASNKKSPIYQKALLAMRDTGYTPSKIPDRNTPQDSIFQKYLAKFRGKEDDVYSQLGGRPKPSVSTAPSSPSILDVLNNYLKQIMASEKLNKKLYKRFLPKNNMVIKVEAQNIVDSVEFARILCVALDEELLAKAFVHTNGSDVEVECTISGPEQECFETTKQLTSSMVEAFYSATSKIGGIKVKTNFITNKRSYYQPISFKTASTHYRQFLLKFI